MNETQVGLSCQTCGCIRQVRTAAFLQDPVPGAKTRFTFLQTACPACGAATQFLVFLEDGWTVQDGDRQTVACTCGSTRFFDADHDAEEIRRGIRAACHDVVCAGCGREGIVFIFSGAELVSSKEIQSIFGIAV